MNLFTKWLRQARVEVGCGSAVFEPVYEVAEPEAGGNEVAEAEAGENEVAEPEYSNASWLLRYQMESMLDIYKRLM